MHDFTFHNPVKILFGRNALDKLAGELAGVGKKVLLVTGGHSARATGLYDRVIRDLKKTKKTVYEVSGVRPNPRLTSVREGIVICKKHKVDFILAVGGGSAIDAAKAMAVGAKTKKDVWDFYLGRAEVKDALPLGDVLTLAATGTEMNGNSVITDWDHRDKLAIGSRFLLPKFSILDPQTTFTVPRDQTVNGCVDIMSHVFEQYFGKTSDCPLQDRFAEAILKTVIENTQCVLDAPKNYEARANLMWCGTLALNSLISMGKDQDWATHAMEHAVSAVYDIAHGEGLSILTPQWMLDVMDHDVAKFKQYAVRVWDVSAMGRSDREVALEGIHKTKEFFRTIGAPVSLKEVGVNPGPKEIRTMVGKAVGSGTIGNVKKLTKKDVENILKASL